jgi:uroporphyrinogen decarboxylase
MAELSPVQRVMRVLRREEPDRIPHFEWSIDRKVRQAICPGSSMEEFTLRMGLDAILTAPDFRQQPIGPNRTRNEWGVISETAQDEHSVPIEGPIKTIDDLRRYAPPDPCAAGRYQSLERLVRKYKRHLAIGVHLNDVFSIPRCLMGLENLMVAVAELPELVRGLVELSVQTSLAMARESARRGADFVFSGDDYTSRESPLVSPRTFEELFYPGLKRAIAGFKQCGLAVIHRTGGAIGSLLEMIVDSGIDCLDSIDPGAGMDIGRLKQQYAGRIALKGNVDSVRTLTFGTEQQVVEETKAVIRKAAQGGGLILSSSNGIHSSIKPGNYLAMWNAVRMYGRYPISLDPWGE